VSVIDDETLENDTNRTSTSTEAESLSPERWLQAHGDLLFRMAISKVRDRDVAEDIVQEVFVSAWRARDTYAGRSTEATWLVGILRKRLADYFRSQARQNRIRFDSHSPESSATEANTLPNIPLAPSISSQVFETRLEAVEFRQIVSECLKAMPVHLRQAFQLRLENGDLDVHQLSQLLGINPANTSVRLYRARLLMRHCVERRWSE
jgi:RNA polymerase sigma factor (sigma-70 family)